MHTPKQYGSRLFWNSVKNVHPVSADCSTKTTTGNGGMTIEHPVPFIFFATLVKFLEGHIPSPTEVECTALYCKYVNLFETMNIFYSSVLFKQKLFVMYFIEIYFQYFIFSRSYKVQSWYYFYHPVWPWPEYQRKIIFQVNHATVARSFRILYGTSGHLHLTCGGPSILNKAVFVLGKLYPVQLYKGTSDRSFAALR